MGKYFKIEELLKSDTANKYGISNEPTDQHKKNLNELIDNLLDPIRIYWIQYCINHSLGNPAIRVSSGYRSTTLNAVIPNSSPTSAHSLGLAADLIPVNGKLKEFREFIYEFLKTWNFDQCIFEEIDSEGIPKWVHVGLKNSDNEQRKQFLTWDKKSYQRVY